MNAWWSSLVNENCRASEIPSIFVASRSCFMEANDFQFLPTYNYAAWWEWLSYIVLQHGMQNVFHGWRTPKGRINWNWVETRYSSFTSFGLTWQVDTHKYSQVTRSFCFHYDTSSGKPSLQIKEAGSRLWKDFFAMHCSSIWQICEKMLIAGKSW